MADQTSSRLLRCVIVTPEKTVLDVHAASVSLPLDDGSRGVAVGHTPFIGRLGSGVVRMAGVEGRPGAETTVRTFVEGGFVEVSGEAVTVITQQAVDSASLDPAAARADLETLRSETATGDEAIAARMAAETVARARLRAAEQRD